MNECIVFTFYNDNDFFLFVINIWGVKNALNFDIGDFSEKKVNLVGTFKRSKLKFPEVLESVWEPKNKL